jgi:hypothetical protein
VANTVNQPDGSSVSPKNPPDAAAGGGDNLWVEAYSLDLSAESAQDLSSAGTATRTMGGVLWTAQNNTASDFQTDGFELDGSNGLCIWPDSNKGIYTTSMVAGVLSAKVADLVGVAKTYALNKQAVCIQATATSGTDVGNDYDAWGLIVWNGYTGTGQTDVRYLLSRAIYESSAKSQIVGYTENSGGTATWMDYEVTTASQADRDFYQIIIWPGPDYISAIYGTVGNMPDSGDFPDPNDFTPTIGTSVMFSDATDSSAFTLANLRFGLTAQDENAVTDIQPIFSSLRVLYMDVT